MVVRYRSKAAITATFAFALSSLCNAAIAQDMADLSVIQNSADTPSEVLDLAIRCAAAATAVGVISKQTGRLDIRGAAEHHGRAFMMTAAAYGLKHGLISSVDEAFPKMDPFIERYMNGFINASPEVIAEPENAQVLKDFGFCVKLGSDLGRSEIRNLLVD